MKGQWCHLGYNNRIVIEKWILKTSQKLIRCIMSCLFTFQISFNKRSSDGFIIHKQTIENSEHTKNIRNQKKNILFLFLFFSVFLSSFKQSSFMHILDRWMWYQKHKKLLSKSTSRIRYYTHPQWKSYLILFMLKMFGFFFHNKNEA